MHATIEQLLNYRDGLPLMAECKTHLEQCEICLNELQSLKVLKNNLQALPTPALSEDHKQLGWQEISNELSRQKKYQMPHFYWSAATACALLVALILGLQNSQNFSSHTQTTQVDVAMEKEKPGTGNLATSVIPATELEQLMAYSRALESRLQALPQQPRLVRANTAGTISQLEDQISLLDDRLNLDYQTPLTEQQRNALWQLRVSSMNNLYTVRTAQLQRGSY